MDSRPWTSVHAAPLDFRILHATEEDAAQALPLSLPRPVPGRVSPRRSGSAPGGGAPPPPPDLVLRLAAGADAVTVPPTGAQPQPAMPTAARGAPGAVCPAAATSQVGPELWAAMTEP